MKSYSVGKYIIPHSYGESVGAESRKTWHKKAHNGFFDKYMYGDNGLDIGGTGYLENVNPILPSAKIVGLDYPGYDERTLPFKDNSQDYVYNSHVLEHISNYEEAIKEWFRVTKQHGCIIITVPHRDLYERKHSLPSIWNQDHKRFYTPGSLLQEIEYSLNPNSYRIRHLQDNDANHIYGVQTDIHASGEYEIEVVIQKL